ncbi:MAG: hypothetical protein GTO24_21190 [candidate division Zixibacteria bacterium]|nr:hypothetical protein [candidate division Zixibacteria bacterium]
MSKLSEDLWERVRRWRPASIKDIEQWAYKAEDVENVISELAGANRVLLTIAEKDIEVKLRKALAKACIDNLGPKTKAIMKKSKQ